eukprot:CFRG4460T1
MGLADDLLSHFETSDLYEVLQVKDHQCPESKIKTAYYKLARLYHPDKCTSDRKEDKTLQTVKFQLLGKVYTILSDKDRRTSYNETGVVDDDEQETQMDGDVDWNEYFNAIFNKVSTEAILKATREYQLSREERDDVIEAYKKCKGNISEVLDMVMCADELDIPRFVKLIEEEIEAGNIKRYALLKKSLSAKSTSIRKRKAAKEQKEAERMLDEIKGKMENGNKRAKQNQVTSSAHTCTADGGGDLLSMIQTRQRDRKHGVDSMLAAMEAKYARKATKKGQEKWVEPSEEEFAAASARLERNRDKANKTKTKTRI